MTGHGYGRAGETVEQFVAKKWYSAEFAWPDKPATLKSHVVEVYHLLEAVAHACFDILAEGLQVSEYATSRHTLSAAFSTRRSSFRLEGGMSSGLER